MFKKIPISSKTKNQLKTKWKEPKKVENGPTKPPGFQIITKNPLMTIISRESGS